VPRNRQDLRRRLESIAFPQAGYFTAAQALEAGYTYQAQKYHADSGNWVRIDRGIFRIPNWPTAPSDQQVLESLVIGNHEENETAPRTLVPGAVQSHTPDAITAQDGRGGSGDYCVSLPAPGSSMQVAQTLRRMVSEPRFAVYERAANDDLALAGQLYLWDRELSLAILRDIAMVEVALRNAMGHQLEVTFGRNWYLDPILNRDQRLIGARDKAIQSLKQMAKKPNSDLVISQLPLGFWVNLTNAPSDQLWRRSLYKAFPFGKPEARAIGERFERAWVLSKLQTIRVLRNRCAHHEPLLNGFPLPGATTRLNVSQGVDAYLLLARMIDADFGTWLNQDSTVLNILANQPESKAPTETSEQETEGV